MTSDANMRAGHGRDGRYTDTEWRDEMNIKEFCKAHLACPEGYIWAMENCKTMRDVWDTARPDWIVWVATRKGVLTDKELRLFACWCVRQVWDLLTDERSRTAVEVAERYANGEATAEELSSAMADAKNIARDAATYAATYAAYNIAWAAAWDAAEAAAEAVWDNTNAAQAEYLRSNCKPCFSEVKP